MKDWSTGKYGHCASQRCACSPRASGNVVRGTVAVFALAISVVFATAEETEPDAVEQPVSLQDVHRVNLVLVANVEALRVFADKPLVDTWSWRINDATPRHLFFMAQILHMKSSKLAQEMVDVPSMASPPVPAGEISEADVFALLNVVNDQIEGIATRLQVPVATNPTTNMSWRSAVVMGAMITTSRQLSAMLHREFRYADIYSQIEGAVYSAAQLTGAYPPLPQLEVSRSAVDIYSGLIECLEYMRRFAINNDLPSLRLNFRRESRRRDVAVADVYDLAALTAADMAWLTSRVLISDAEETPLPYSRPIPILPSHSYRLTLVLDTQLRNMIGQ